MGKNVKRKINPCLTFFTQLIGGVALFLLSFNSYAWSNYFRVFNNSDQVISLTINPKWGNAHNDCADGATPHHLTIPAKSASCKIQFTTTYGESSGSIYIEKNKASCRVDYNYQYNPLDFFAKYALNFSTITCTNSENNTLETQSLLLDNTKNENYSPLGQLFNSAISPIRYTYYNDQPESLAESNCSAYQANGNLEKGPDNCLIVNPNYQWIGYALKLQEQLDKYEPINHAQFLGTHNSSVSPYYTTNKSFAAISFSDPNHYQPIKDQLDSGVRSIELDMIWKNNQLVSCHNHVDLPNIPFLKDTMKALTCDGNASIQSILTEMKEWLAKPEHKNSLILLYLDVNQPLGVHAQAASDLFGNELKNFVMTKQDLAPGNIKSLTWGEQNRIGFPANLLSKQAILQLNRNIVIMSHDKEELADSPYIFTQVANDVSNKIGFPSDHGFDDFNQFVKSCSDPVSKYALIQKIFPDDKAHASVWRLNDDRSLISYLGGAAPTDDPSRYIDLGSLALVQNVLQCPINMLSLDMLNATYMNDEDRHAKNYPKFDPRIVAWIWSWQENYPVNDASASKIAYLDPLTKHFKNDARSTPYLLCYNRSAAQPGMTEWGIVNNTTLNDSTKTMTTDAMQSLADAACATKGSSWYFATPVTSYQMADVVGLLTMLKIKDPVLVNYMMNGSFSPASAWIANQGKSLF